MTTIDRTKIKAILADLDKALLELAKTHGVATFSALRFDANKFMCRLTISAASGVTAAAIEDATAPADIRNGYYRILVNKNDAPFFRTSRLFSALAMLRVRDMIGAGIEGLNQPDKEQVSVLFVNQYGVGAILSDTELSVLEVYEQAKSESAGDFDPAQSPSYPASTAEVAAAMNLEGSKTAEASAQANHNQMFADNSMSRSENGTLPPGY